MRHQKVSTDVNLILWAQDGFSEAGPTAWGAGVDEVLEREDILMWLRLERSLAASAIRALLTACARGSWSEE